MGLIAAILLAVAFFEHGAGGHVSVWFNWEGTMILGLFFLALHVCWPWTPWRRP